MAEYRVGVAVPHKAEQQVVWLETRRPDLQPQRVEGVDDGHVRLILTFNALSNADAIARTSMVFDQAARGSGGAAFESGSGPIDVQAWKVGDDPPAQYRATNL
jgi:hypothetical protein